MTRKQRKPTTKAPARTESSSEQPVDIASKAIATGLTALQGRIRSLSVELEAPGKLDDRELRDKASHLAWLMKQIAQVQAEQRKQDAADRKNASSADPQTVAAYLRALDPAEWSHLRREIDQHHSGGSVLG